MNKKVEKVKVEKKTKLTKFNVFRFLCLIAYIGCTGVLIFESSLDGQNSAAHSNAVGGAIQDVVNNLGGDGTTMVIPESVTIDNKITTGYVGDTYKLEVTTRPDNASYKAIDFASSDESVAVISTDGTISFLKQGSVTFTATNHDYRDFKDEFTMEVLNVDVTSITASINANLNVDVYTLYLENTYKVSSKITPTNATFKDISYSLDSNSYIKIDENGNISPIAYSKDAITTITVKCGAFEDTLKVVVDYANVIKLTDYTLSGDSFEIFKTESKTISVTPVPADATFSDYTLVSSDPSIVSVSNKKSFKGVKPGTATLTLTSATYETVSKTITVTVKEQPAITSFTIPSTLEVVEGSSKTIKASDIKPAYATSPFTYVSADPSYVSVKNGKVTGVKPTTSPVIITVTANGYEQQISVTVKEYVHVEVDDKDTTTKDFTISYLQGETPLVYVNNSINLSEYFTIDKFIKNDDSEYTPSKTSFTYSVDSAYGTLSNTTFTPTANGLIPITLTHTNSGKTNEVTVYALDTYQVDFDIPSENFIDNVYNLKASDTFNFIISSEAFNRDPVIQQFEVISSSSLATINQNEDGSYSVNVANTAGTFDIIVKCSDEKGEVSSLTQTHSFNVAHNLISNIDISIYNEENEKVILRTDETDNHYLFEMQYNDVYYVSSSFFPENASSYNLSYSSSNQKIISVDPTGKLVVGGVGDVTITITDSVTGSSKSIDITVSNVIALDETNIITFKGNQVSYDSNSKTYSLTNGYSGSINLNFLEESTYTKVSYSSSNENVIKVSQSGILTPISTGKSTITMTINDGMQEPTIISVTVEVKPQPIIKDVQDFFLKIRKGLGHFGAFLVLGIFSTLTYLLYFRNKKWFFSIPLNIYMGFTLAAMTEYIQTQVVGRYGCWSDIWIDFSGFMCSTTILSIVIPLIYLFKYLKNKKKAIKQTEEKKG